MRRTTRGRPRGGPLCLAQTVLRFDSRVEGNSEIVNILSNPLVNFSENGLLALLSAC